MGRNTWESLPKRPLAGRYNVVLSRTLAREQSPNLLITDNIEEILGRSNVYIIGGEQIYREFLSRKVVDRIIATEVNGAYGGDTFFPTILKSEWNEVSRHKYEQFNIVEYQKCLE